MKVGKRPDSASGTESGNGNTDDRSRGDDTLTARRIKRRLQPRVPSLCSAFSGFDSFHGLKQSPRVFGTPHQVSRFFERIVFFPRHHHHGTGVSSGYYHGDSVVADLIHGFRETPSRFAASYYLHRRRYRATSRGAINPAGGRRESGRKTGACPAFLNYRVKSYSFFG